MVQSFVKPILQFGLTTGLATAGVAAFDKGTNLLEQSGTPGHNALGLPNNPIRGNEKAGKPYVRPNGEGYAIDITGTDGKVRTEPINERNVGYTDWRNMNAYNQEVTRLRAKGELKRSEEKLEKRDDKHHGRGPSGAQKATMAHEGKLQEGALASGERNVVRNVGGQVTVATIQGKSEDRATDAGVTMNRENLSFKDRELLALREQAERRQALDERIQTGNERNTSYDQQMNSWRANAEIEAAQHAYRKNLPSGLATAAQGLAMLMG
jgi:hypothetical protein